MANPQCENGYTRVANEILEHLAKIHICGNELRIVVFVLRKTYGFGKTVDKIANSQICQGTGLGKTVVSRARKSLLERYILTETEKGHLLGLQKNWEVWKVSKSGTLRKLAKVEPELAKVGQKVSSPEDTQKKERNYTKEMGVPPPYSLGGWLERVRRANNPISELGEMLIVLSDGKEAPDYPRLGKMAKDHSGPGYIADLIWGCARAMPKGNWLDYIQGMLRKRPPEPMGELREF